MEYLKTTTFNNKEFGSVRMIEDQGRLLFCGIDVAAALGYAKPRNALAAHCKGALKRGALTAGGVQELTFIPEAGYISGKHFSICFYIYHSSHLISLICSIGMTV